MKLKKEEVKKLFEILMKSVDDSLEEEFELDYSMFYSIMFHLAQDLTLPPEPTMADLRDDVEFCLQLLDEEEYSPCMITFEKFGNIIKAIGHKCHLH